MTEVKTSQAQPAGRTFQIAYGRAVLDLALSYLSDAKSVNPDDLKYLGVIQPPQGCTYPTNSVYVLSLLHHIGRELPKPPKGSESRFAALQAAMCADTGKLRSAIEALTAEIEKIEAAGAIAGAAVGVAAGSV